ncbi:MAG: hypothetical protein WC670_03935 [Pseudolabrys sp.]|jgi:hypothetical protein
MRSARLVITLATLWAAAGGVLAQDAGQPPVKELPPAPPPALPADPQKDAMPQGAGRFSFSRVDGGFLRLDSAGGQVSFCSQRSVGWVCQAVPDDRAALDDEIARLQGEVAALQDRIAEAVPPRPPADLAPPPGNGSANGDARLKLPSREEMERARAALERAWRHLVDTITEFQKDMMKKG